MDEIEICPYISGEEKELINLLINTFNPWPRFDLSSTPLDYWTWKFRDNPQNRLLITLAKFNDEIVGCYHSLSQCYKIGDRIIPVYQGVDVAVRDDFRGKGIYKKIAQYTYTREDELGESLHLGIETQEATLKVATQNRFLKIPHQPVILIKILDEDKFFPGGDDINLVKKGGYRVLSALNKITHTNPNLSQINYLVEEITRFDERAIDFLKGTLDGYQFIQDRTIAHLNWRFCDPRGGEYKVTQALENNNVIGYIVTRLNKYNRRGFIVDLLTSPRGNEAVETLITHACESLEERGAVSINVSVFHDHPYETTFNQHGFINVMPLPLYYRSITPGALSRLAEGGASTGMFSYGDFDWI